MNVSATEMNRFFNITDDKYKVSLAVNSQLLSMGKAQLKEVIARFGLLPVNEYLALKTLRYYMTDDKVDMNLDGFARYIDAYLIEISGGKRSELIQIGTNIMGRKPKAYSTRLIRLEILDYLLSPHD